MRQAFPISVYLHFHLSTVRYLISAPFEYCLLVCIFLIIQICVILTYQWCLFCTDAYSIVYYLQIVPIWNNFLSKRSNLCSQEFLTVDPLVMKFYGPSLHVFRRIQHLLLRLRNKSNFFCRFESKVKCNNTIKFWKTCCLALCFNSTLMGKKYWKLNCVVSVFFVI